MTKGSSASGLLNYCMYEKEKLSIKEKEALKPFNVRGKLIFVQNLTLNILNDGRFDVDDLSDQMEKTASLNPKLKDYMWHQSFSFPVGENPDDDTLDGIIRDFVQEFGFEDNQVTAWQHSDKSHAHIHICANRINSIGKTSASDSNAFLRTGDFCRNMEKKYNLSATVNMKKLRQKDKLQEQQFSKSEMADIIRAKIDMLIPSVSSIEELKKKLKIEGVKMYIGRGVAFVDMKSGAKYKGSDLGREYSLMKLTQRIQIEPMPNQVNKSRNVLVHKTPGTSKDSNFEIDNNMDFPNIGLSFGKTQDFEGNFYSGKRTFETEEEAERKRKRRKR